MAFTVGTYVDPGSIITQVFLPNAIAVAGTPFRVCIITTGPRNKRYNDEPITRGIVKDETVTGWVYGTAGAASSFGAVTNGTYTVTLTGASISADAVGRTVTFRGAANAGNNGTFPVIARTSGTEIIVGNYSGVAETNFAGTYFISAPLSNRGDRKVANTIVKKTLNGVTTTLPASQVYYRPAVLRGQAAPDVGNTYELDTSGAGIDSIAVQLDGKIGVSVRFIDGGTGTPAPALVGGTESAVTMTMGGTDGNATTSDDLRKMINSGLSAVTGTGLYGTAYGVAAGTSGIAFGEGNILTLFSPTATSASDLRVHTPLSHNPTGGTARSAVAKIFGATSADAATLIEIDPAAYDANATYMVTYCAIADTADPVSVTDTVSSVVQVGAYARTATFSPTTDYTLASNAISWAHPAFVAAQIVSPEPQNHTITAGSQDTIILGLDGKTNVTVDFNGSTAVLGYADLAGGAVTSQAVATDINAVMANNTAYGTRYGSIASVSGTAVRLASPNEAGMAQGAATSITVTVPTGGVSAVAELFGTAISGASPYTVYGMGRRPSIGSVYFATYEASRPTSEYNRLFQFFSKDQGISQMGPVAATNPMSCAIDFAFAQGAPAVYAIQINDTTTAGAPTDAEVTSALNTAGMSKGPTEVVLVSPPNSTTDTFATRTASTSSLLAHVEDESSPTNAHYRCAWHGRKRSYPVGDADTPNSFVYDAARQLQPSATSPGRGRHVLIAPPQLTGVSRDIIDSDTGATVNVTLDSTWLALGIAARMTSFTSAADTLVRQTIRGLKTDDVTNPWLRSERHAMASKGVTVVTYDAGSFKLLDPVTTEVGGGGLLSKSQISVRTQQDNLSWNVQTALDAGAVGIVPFDLASFIVDIKAIIGGVIEAEIGKGNLAPFKDGAGIVRAIDLRTDLNVEQSKTNATQFVFQYSAMSRFPALRFFGEQYVDNPVVNAGSV